MDYKIIDIEGIGDVYAEKLIAAGINKVSELLEKCAAPKGRKALAEETGISEMRRRDVRPWLKRLASARSSSCAGPTMPTCSASTV